MNKTYSVTFTLGIKQARWGLKQSEPGVPPSASEASQRGDLLQHASHENALAAASDQGRAVEFPGEARKRSAGLGAQLSIRRLTATTDTAAASKAA